MNTPVNTPKKFAAFDIDGTLMRWQLFHTIVDELARRDRVTMSEYKKIRDLFARWKRRTEVNSFHIYEEAMLTTWYALLKTVTPEEYRDAVQAVFEDQKDYTYRYTRNLIKALKQQDYTLIAISGSHQEIVDMIANYYDFDIATGSVYPTENGKFTGEEITPVIDKGVSLKNIVKEHNLTWEGSYAVGDSGSDSKMMEIVENPVAFNPDNTLLTIAKKQGWNIVVERKNVIYQLTKVEDKYLLS